MINNLSKEEIREQNKKRVLMAAIDCIKEYGIQDIKVSNIANKVGVTTRSIQRYYGSKEHLLMEAVKYLMDKKYYNTVLRFKELKLNQNTGIELAKQFFDTQKDYFKINHIDFLVIIEIEIFFYRKGISTENFTKHVESLSYIRNLLSEIIDLGKEDGTIRADVDSTELSTMMELVFVGILRRFSVIYNNDKKMGVPIDLDKQVELTVDMLLNYLKKG